jgi:hypothetical protein
MKNLHFKSVLSAFTLVSISMFGTVAKAAPVRFDQVVQVVNAKPGKANTSGFVQLRLADENLAATKNDGDDDKKPAPKRQQDERVITETKAEIVEDDACDCEPLAIPKGGFPKYALLGLGGLPLLFLIPHDKDETPTPNTPTTPTVTPTITITPTPPEPVPEPMTILLFGTGLASIGLAARRKFGKKDVEENQE